MTQTTTTTEAPMNLYAVIGVGRSSNWIHPDRFEARHDAHVLADQLRRNPPSETLPFGRWWAVGVVQSVPGGGERYKLVESQTIVYPPRSHSERV